MNFYNLDHLSPEDFEEFCYELLSLEGFKNLSWRKGTGLSGSPSDQGRDIQGHKPRRLIGNRTILETWFFECKHCKIGVAPDKILGALSWAAAERPNYLVLIASGAFTNGTKNFLEDYQRNNRPPFHIQLIERKDLQGLFEPHQSLLEKYRIHPRMTGIVLDYLATWDDISLAKAMRVISDAARTACVTVTGIGGGNDTAVRVDLSPKHAELLKHVMANALKREHLGIKYEPELLSLDLGISRSEVFSIEGDISAIDIAAISGFMPSILKISPVSSKRPNDGQE